ncbi:MAG: GNAT family N-acetyltransferase [Candidatus Contendobacter sp.]|nr:GNAT family N-acetyltransferase [Candidatus Contendobacter sp.]
MSTESLIVTNIARGFTATPSRSVTTPDALNFDLTTRFARSREEVAAAQRLRYAIFAEEMGAKLHNRIPNLDHDRLDAYCLHLIVRDALNRIVGCTRILTTEAAQRAGGFYSQTEFDLTPVLDLPGRFMEIGRTCIHPDYRNGAAINALWSGLAAFIAEQRIDYLIGCASMPLGANGGEAQALYADLAQRHLVSEALRVRPHLPLPRRTDVATCFPRCTGAANPAGNHRSGIARAAGSVAGDPDGIRMNRNTEAVSSPHSGHPARLPKTVAALITPVTPIAPALTVAVVSELFLKKPQLYYLPIVDGNMPVGMVYRLDFMNIFLSRYGRELYSRKPIASFMAEPLLIEQDTPLEDASRLITRRLDKRFELPAFIITHKGYYRGLGWMMDLLEKITDLRVQSARYSNPLTLLPGNVPIDERISDLLQTGQFFTVAYCDLDHFKPYNDIYGYERGDRIIQMTGELLSAHIDPERDFVGHIGGDDFIIIFQSNDWQVRCDAVLQEFGQRVPDYYHSADRERGGIQSKDRQGQPVFFPLLSLSIGVVQPDPAQCGSHHEVAMLATGAKHQAKLQAGNSLFMDRRQGTNNVPV